MRQFYIIISGVILTISCSKENIHYENYCNDTLDSQTKASVSMPEESYLVTPKMARVFASSLKKDAKVVSQDYLIEKEDTLAYIFNYEKGWVCIPADKRLDPVLMSDDEGSFSSKESGNPGMDIWMKTIKHQVQTAKEERVDPTDIETYEMWNKLETICHPEKLRIVAPQLRDYDDSTNGDFPYYICITDVSTSPFYTMNTGHLLSTKWGQAYPWNANMLWGWSTNLQKDTMCVMGCVAVAASQMLYYLHYELGKPNGLYHTITPYGYKLDQDTGTQGIIRENYNANSSRWDDMAYDRFDSHTDYVGDFLAEVGFRIGTKYSADASGAVVSTDIFDEYGIDCDMSSYDESTVYNSILSGYPVMANAYSERDGDWPFYSYSGGHAWVIDGWRKKRYNYTTTYHWIVIGSTNDEANIDWTQGNITQYTYSQGLSLSGGNEYTYSYSQSPEYNYILMNWGWDGSYDNTDYSSSTAINWTAGGHTFEYIVEIMYGFN